LIRRSGLDLLFVPAVVIAAVAGIIVYTIGGVSFSSSGATPTPLPTVYYPEGEPVIFVSITDAAGVTYLPYESKPPDVYNVSNPIMLALGIGAGMRYQNPGEAVTAGHGHLYVLIDDDAPPIPGDLMVPDATHISLGNAHVVTLPQLSPGRHTISAVFADASEHVTAPYGVAVLQIDVAPPSP
jgi:hypothetical protein